jgi:hypothetical protein
MKTDDRSLLASSAAVAVFVGYVLLPDWAALKPERHWQWLPYVGVTAAAVSALAPTSRGLWAVRWALLTIAALIAAWKVVPDWESLYPPRTASIALLAGGMIVLAAAVEALPDRLCRPPLVTLLSATAGGAMVALVASVSFKFGQLAGLAAGALAGCAIACARRELSPAIVRGLAPVAAMLIVGLAYIGCIEPEPPILAMLLLPAAPLALWLCAVGPLARLHGPAAIAAQVAGVLLPLLAATALACLPSPQPAW